MIHTESLVPGAASRPSGEKSSPLRVLQIGKYYPPHMGGIETHLQALCDELRGQTELRVVVANDGRETTEALIDGVPVVRAGTAFHLASAPICPTMVSALRASPADVVHVHLPNPFAVLAYLASGHRGRLVVSYHSDVVRQRLLGAAFEPVLHRFLRRADSIVVASPNYIESSPTLRRHRAKCRVIPYGIDVAAFRTERDERVRAIRERFGPRLVLSVGRLVYYKGFQHLIRAMEQVKGSLVIIGGGPLRDKLAAMVRHHGLESRVHLLGGVDDVIPYYQAADVFALPSIARSEAFGIVQLEAMACGVPVVNTRLDSGVPFVSQHEVTGLTVEPCRQDELAGAINSLLDDERLRQRLGQNARARVASEFEKEVMGARFMELYHGIVSSPAVPVGGRPR